MFVRKMGSIAIIDYEIDPLYAFMNSVVLANIERVVFM